MKLLICGGRDLCGLNAYRALCSAIAALPLQPNLIIHGGADGADMLADSWSKSHGVYAVRIDALWLARGKAAGGERNQAMLAIIKPDHCIALPGGAGTADMIRRCQRAGIPVTAVVEV